MRPNFLVHFVDQRPDLILVASDLSSLTYAIQGVIQQQDSDHVTCKQKQTTLYAHSGGAD